MKFVTIILILSAFLFLTSDAFGYEIFVWSNTNSLVLIDPVLEDTATVVELVTSTLDALEMEYTMGQSLPEDILDFDVVVIPLGFACPQ